MWPSKTDLMMQSKLKRVKQIKKNILEEMVKVTVLNGQGRDKLAIDFV